MAWTSTRPLPRITPAMAPATATGLEVAETLSTSTGVRSAVIAGTPSKMFTIDALDRRSPACGGINVNQYRIESHGSGSHGEAVRDPGQEPLQDDVLVHPDAAVPGPHHAHVGHIGSALRQDPSVSRGNVGVGTHYRARTAVEVPAHGGLLRGRLGVHVTEDDPDVRVRCEDRVGGPKRIVEVVQEDAADEV